MCSIMTTVFRFVRSEGRSGLLAQLASASVGDLFGNLRGRGVADRRNHALRLEQLEPKQLLAAAPVINEFMARNDGGIRDGDGRSSDWIEIFNASDMPVDLAGPVPEADGIVHLNLVAGLDAAPT